MTEKSSSVNATAWRCRILTITKKNGAVTVLDYPKKYDICSAFSSFSALTNDEFAALSDSDYQLRLESFVAYVENIEKGLEIDTTTAFEN